VTADDILAIFERAGLRNTRPRRVIAERLAALASSGADFSTDDLWHDLHHGDGQPSGQLGRATVYRTVEALMEHGLLDRVEFADGTHRYRVCGAESHHHHLVCTCCHRIVAVDACLPADLLAAIETATDFLLEGHTIELFGRCADCRG
jgi:Fe2+ or Zn2+ uptake regulation protein